MVTQLTLSLHVGETATFANFHPDKNQKLLTYLQQFLAGKVEPYVYLWGHAGVGCTHLLQASCQQIHEQGGRAVYLPLKQLHEFKPELLDDLENLALICIDDLDVIKGNKLWEEALFHLYNRVQNSTSRLLIAAHAVPAELGLLLPDLRSRLASSLIFQVHELSDADKLAALQLRAKQRGLELPTDVGQFLLHRFPRDLPALSGALEQLDQASLAAQRKLTIPFIKQVLGI